MSHEVRADAASEIAAALFQGERALEAVIAQAAAVMGTLPTVREAAGLSVFHCQEALEEAGGLFTLLTQARRQIGVLHRKLEATQRQVGLGHVAYGDVTKPPPPPAIVDELREAA